MIDHGLLLTRFLLLIRIVSCLILTNIAVGSGRD